LHIGHIRMFEEAKKHGDKLVVILNNDNWIRHKRGVEPFMPETERKEVLEALRVVDQVVLTEHPENVTDRSVSHILLKHKPHVFANGGDRDEKDSMDPTSPLYWDLEMCKKIDCKVIFNVGHGGKVQSSSWLIDKAKTKAKSKK